jgi:hypothetical protein
MLLLVQELLMIHVKTDEPLWNYADKENFFVVPTTTYIRKDGVLALVSPVAKDALSKFPQLAKRWGYMMSMGVIPTYRSGAVNLIGLADRAHYASKPDKDTIEASLYALNERADNSPGFIFYLYEPLGGWEYLNTHLDILKCGNIVLLEPIKEMEHETDLRELR